MSDHISNDLINEIFERLPPKSLMRFRSLSKSWCSRIQSTNFIKRHALRSRKKTPKILIRHLFYDVKENKQIIVFLDEYPMFRKSRDDMYTIHSEDQFVSSNPEWLDVSIPAVKFPTTMGDTHIGDIIGSCNGILCLYCHSNRTMSLWNPSIRRVTTLPQAPEHPSRCAILVGIGFDQSIDDYKIVRISVKSSFVYTIKTGAWCPIASPTTEFGYPESRACFFNGALHWVVVGTSNSVAIRYILTFDLSTHVFGEICLPKLNRVTNQLTIINGSLAVIPTNPTLVYGKDNSIWILKESNKCWHDVYEFGKFQPIWNNLDRGAKGILQLKTNGHMFLYIGNRLPNFSEGPTYGMYNPETGTWVPSMIMRFQDSKHIDMETYVESLELLDTKMDCQGQRWTTITDCNDNYSHNKYNLKRDYWNAIGGVDSLRSQPPPNVEQSDKEEHIEFWLDPKHMHRATINAHSMTGNTIFSHHGSRSLAVTRNQYSHENHSSSLLARFYDMYTRKGVWLQEDARLLYEEMIKLRDLGTTEEDMLVMVIKSQQQVHKTGRGWQLAGRGKSKVFGLQPRGTHAQPQIDHMKAERDDHLDETAREAKASWQKLNEVWSVLRTNPQWTELLSHIPSRSEIGSGSWSGGANGEGWSCEGGNGEDGSGGGNGSGDGDGQ